MPRYTFKPNYEKHLELYKENAGENSDMIPLVPNGLNALLIVTAEDDEECISIRNMISHSPSWELISTED
jgi:hypothetical protein